MGWGTIWLGGRSNLVVIDRDDNSRSGRGYTAKSYILALEKGLIPFYTTGTISAR